MLHRNEENMGERFEWNGYAYETKAELEEAKREAESVRYIRAKTDLKNPAIVSKLYQGLVQKKTFVTPVGIEFMNELRDTLLSDKTMAQTEIPCIPVSLRTKKGKNALAYGMEKEKRDLQRAEYYEGKLRIQRRISLVLVLVIVAMFLITLFGPNTPFVDAEIKLQDKYAAWEQQLTERENAVAKREQALE